MIALIHHLMSLCALPHIRGSVRAAIFEGYGTRSNCDTNLASTLSADPIYRGHPIRQSDCSLAACSNGSGTDDRYCVEPHRCHLDRENGQAIIESTPQQLALLLAGQRSIRTGVKYIQSDRDPQRPEQGPQRGPLVWRITD